jgi:hypothetical protein
MVDKIHHDAVNPNQDLTFFGSCFSKCALSGVVQRILNSNILPDGNEAW